MAESKKRVLFVCLGNICRSPAAEGVFRAFVEQRGAAKAIEIDSAGTSAWHVGEPPDRRMIRIAGARGYDLKALRARQARSKDFLDFHLIVAMDHSNIKDLRDIRPKDARAKLIMLGEYLDAVNPKAVPDPYAGDDDGFDTVLDMIEAACGPILADLQKS
jgi:protein-tyrosine phosphatase